jgi:hypothetical protein
LTWAADESVPFLNLTARPGRGASPRSSPCRAGLARRYKSSPWPTRKMQ